MRRLMLLRHAKSDWPGSGTPDHERGLAPRGKAAAPRMGRYMAEQALIPDHAIVSTAKRTRDTWRLVAEALGKEPAAVFDKQVYEASPRDILASIAQAPAAAKSVLVVGHNPGLQDTAMIVSHSGDAQAMDAISEKFPTAGLAVIDLDIADWRDIRPGSGRLERFITPRAIGARAD